MNVVKTIGLLAMAFVAVLATALPVFAQGGAAVPVAPVVSVAPFSGAAMGAGLGAGLVIIGAAMGFGKIGAAALESMARQPETAGRVQTAMIIIGALLEGATFFALIVCIQIAGRA